MHRETEPDMEQVPSVAPLDGGLAPLVDYFAANAGKHRVIAVLSPT